MLRAAPPLLDVDRAVLASHDAAALADRRVATFDRRTSVAEQGERSRRRARARAGSRVRDRGGLLVLLSGGASAMLAAPVDGVHLDAKQETARRLMRAGAAIDELNCVRKHLSRIKGGRLAAAAGTTVTLALSDVHAPVADDPSVIGSGPTVADPTTFADAVAIVRGSAWSFRRVCAITSPPGCGAPRRKRSRPATLESDHRATSSSATADGCRRRRAARAESGLRRGSSGRRQSPARRAGQARHSSRRRSATHRGGGDRSVCSDPEKRPSRFVAAVRRPESGVRARERRGVEPRAGPERRHRQRRNGWHRRPDHGCRRPGRRHDDRAAPEPWTWPAGGARAERYVPVLCGAPGL